MSNLLKKEKGFTLIEIVLVLAIAGLLLVIVFLAVSGAQKSRRDSQRKNDLSRIAAQVESYASNHAGNYPDAPSQATFATALTTGGYALSNGNDPLSGSVYSYSSGAGTPTAPSGSTSAGVLYQIGGPGVTACDGSTPLTGTRTFKVRMGLEQGTACVDNN